MLARLARVTDFVLLIVLILLIYRRLFEPSSSDWGLLFVIFLISLINFTIFRRSRKAIENHRYRTLAREYPTAASTSQPTAAGEHSFHAPSHLTGAMPCSRSTRPEV